MTMRTLPTSLKGRNVVKIEVVVTLGIRLGSRKISEGSTKFTFDVFLRCCCEIETSRERPKSAPYRRLKKTRKPLFLQLETTKALKKLKIEKKNSEFFLNFFSKFPVSRIVPKNVKGGTLFISC